MGLVPIVRKGDMSRVGPRIISPPELKPFGQSAMNLLTVRPGLTGLWQLSRRSEITNEERVCQSPPVTAA
jgi:lipopolysaccharide/colanic/teichoic acid biosynthesis glycosyltransferase